MDNSKYVKPHPLMTNCGYQESKLSDYQYCTL